MNDFDCYARWLKIPADRRPPNYYDLLGLPALESDGERIRAASMARTAYVRRFCLGQHGSEATKLLSELATAFAGLIDPVAKAVYDARLSAESGAPTRCEIATADGPPARIDSAKPDRDHGPPPIAGRKDRANRQLLTTAQLPTSKRSVAGHQSTGAMPLSDLDAAFATMKPLAKSVRPLATKPRRPRRPAWQLPAAVGAAVVVLLIGLGWLVASNRRDDEVARNQPMQTQPPAEVQSPTSNPADGNDEVASSQPEQPQPIAETQSPANNPADGNDENATTDQQPLPDSRQPDTKNSEWEIAEEVLRRGGELRLSVNGNVVDARKLDGLPPAGLEVIEVRLAHASAENVADLRFLLPAKRLESLSLFGCPVAVSALAALNGRQTLKILNLEDTRLPSGAVKRLLPLPQLEVLLLANCEVTSQDLRDIATLENLCRLGLQRAKISDGDLRLLKNLPHLRDLLLYDTPITDVGVSALVECAPNLQVLCLATTKMTDDAFQSLGRLKALKILDVAGNSQITGAGFRR